jgi:hypothetical protein
MVSADVRQVESKIDECIQKMSVWNVKRDVLLERLLETWRDGIELVHMLAAHAVMFQVEDGIQSSVGREHLVLTGVYQAIKWAMEYASDEGADEVSDSDLSNLTLRVAAPYQMLVDALKLGAHDMAELAVDQSSKTLSVYEGGNVSGHDAAIIRRDHVTTPFHKQSPLVEDSDQLTTNWNAGQYRQYWQWLQALVEKVEKNTIMAQAGPLAPMVDIMKQPVVVKIPTPPAHLEAVQRDLTLTPEKAKSGMKWKIDSWHDCPLIQVGARLFGVSRTLLTLAAFDDYMLRAAVINDPGQYEKVSGLREERMIERCRKAFSEQGWIFTPHYHLVNPAKEIDGHATKGVDTCIVQLKSTLRPQSPWEVYKRNTDVIEGIRHTAQVLPRFGQSVVGIVVTDGYEGDYATWKESLATGVAVATLADLDWIAKNPQGAFKVLSERAGIAEDSDPQNLPKRTMTLCGWTLRIHDEPKNKQA